VSVDGLARGLRALGHDVGLRPLRLRSGFHTLDRYIYNAGVAWAPPHADLALGVDLDGFLWARQRGVPFVASLKGIIADELRNERGWVRVLLRVQARWERLNTRRADLVMVPSHYSAAVARALYGVPPARLAVVPEPIDLVGWDARFADAPRRAGRGPVVLAVARLYPRKRIGDLLRAAALLRDRVPRLQVRVVGRGPEWDAARRLHAELGLGDAVALLGDVSRRQLAEEYTSADCFCLPSVQEGFGVALLEAMAAGLPVVACRAAAIPEVVLDGQTGVLVEARSPRALADALEGLLRHPEVRQEMGKAGRRRVVEFTPERVAGRFLAAVESVLRHRPSVAVPGREVRTA
jgi:glycosyltransferase involved in cell wall biosynthesis